MEASTITKQNFALQYCIFGPLGSSYISASKQLLLVTFLIVTSFLLLHLALSVFSYIFFGQNTSYCRLAYMVC